MENLENTLHPETSILICPVCQSTLHFHQKYVACHNLHSFDIAKSGYINLLLSHEKNSPHPGDNQEMVKSRVNFLNKAYYFPIVQALNTLIEANSPNHTIDHIADIGCGVGYYLAGIKKHCDLHGRSDTQYWGIDISKDAIHSASKVDKKISWIVGSAIKLPFATHSVSLIISVFSPLYIDEMHRILSRDGQMIVVTPNENHLIELRKRLFTEVKEIDKDKSLEKTAPHFNLVQEFPLTYKVLLNSSEDIRDLLKMTPFYWRSTAQKKAELCALETLSVTIDVTLRSFCQR